jgi:hypothetical protein
VPTRYAPAVASISAIFRRRGAAETPALVMAAMLFAGIPYVVMLMVIWHATSSVRQVLFSALMTLYCASGVAASVAGWNLRRWGLALHAALCLPSFWGPLPLKLTLLGIAARLAPAAVSALYWRRMAW